MPSLIRVRERYRPYGSVSLAGACVDAAADVQEQTRTVGLAILDHDDPFQPDPFLPAYDHTPFLSRSIALKLLTSAPLVNDGSRTERYIRPAPVHSRRGLRCA